MSVWSPAYAVLVKPLEETSEAEWDRVMGINVKAAFLAIKHVVPHMRNVGGGAILLLGRRRRRPRFSRRIAYGPSSALVSPKSLRSATILVLSVALYFGFSNSALI